MWGGRACVASLGREQLGGEAAAGEGWFWVRGGGWRALECESAACFYGQSMFGSTLALFWDVAVGSWMPLLNCHGVTPTARLLVGSREGVEGIRDARRWGMWGIDLLTSGLSSTPTPGGVVPSVRRPHGCHLHAAPLCGGARSGVSLQASFVSVVRLSCLFRFQRRRSSP